MGAALVLDVHACGEHACGGQYDEPEEEEKAPDDIVYLGIDGEGMGRDPHRYVLLAVANEHANGDSRQRRWWVENPDGLSTEECLRFLVNLPAGKNRTFAYSFNYDLTKILQDLPNELLYRLFRPELRKQRSKAAALRGPSPIMWRGFTLNYVGSKFTIRYQNNQIVLWDIWKFYQSKFVAALVDWKVGSGEDQHAIERMKQLRSGFKADDMPEVREYCFQECRHMAILAHKLVDAHHSAGLKLTSFYGAGSTASAMLKLMGIKDALKPTPKLMQHAVASAFFGGRFENSIVGEITLPVKNRDLSSAYPYQTCFLPCLIHGEWAHTHDRHDIDKCTTAVVEYELHPDADKPIEHWAPYPFRCDDGSICFPSESGGGWVWRDEYLAGERFTESVSPGAVKFKSAWVYHTKCKCQPFVKIPHYYRERCRIGKEGAGIVFKLGPNSVYGKLAQSVGSAMFQSWIWAGLITSGCRAQLLDLIALHRNRSWVLMVATDGAFSIAGIGDVPANDVPLPKETETGAPYWDPDKKKYVQKPLGGWEVGDIPQGIFAARPGIYFPLNPTKDDIKKVKGRGVGKGTVLENWKSITDTWRVHGIKKSVVVKDIERFCGAKTSISYSRGSGLCNRASGGVGTKKQELPKYGDWIKRRVEMSFDPLPKRAGVMADGIHLALRRMPRDLVSVPYSKALRSPENVVLAAAALEQLEQPDGDFEDGEGETG